jgi:hypothetical protein
MQTSLERFSVASIIEILELAFVRAGITMKGFDISIQLGNLCLILWINCFFAISYKLMILRHCDAYFARIKCNGVAGAKLLIRRLCREGLHFFSIIKCRSRQ